jgi:hypothetical protein
MCPVSCRSRQDEYVFVLYAMTGRAERFSEPPTRDKKEALKCIALQCSLASMEDQLTVRLPRKLSRAVKSAARRTQRRPSEVVRMALQAFLEVRPARPGRPADSVSGLLGSLETGIPDLAEKHRAYILESLKHAR